MTYVYHCGECCAETEHRYRMGKAPDWLDCEACEGVARRVITASSVHVKGGTKAGYVKR